LKGRDPEAFHVDALEIVEVNAEERLSALIVFDLDDTDTAFEELDARYLAGEAANYSHAWSLIARVFAAINRRELPELTPDWVNIDHRRGIAFEPGDMTAYIRAIWDDAPDVNVYIEAVHRLSDLGAVVTQAATGTSQQGFAAEWRAINISTVDGGLINRCELFDEADIDAALARFEELHPHAPRLENAASRAFERFQTYFAARDWTAMAEILAEDMCNDDRRRVVGAGVLHGRDIDVAHMRAIAEVGAETITSTVIATRGERLVLRRLLFSGEDQGPDAFEAELLGIVEIDSDERIAARLSFDADDLDAAFEELDTRYLAGESAAHAHTWSVIAGTYAAFNRHGLVPDWVSVDHRRGSPFASSDLNATIRASRDLTPDLTIHIETVHRLSAFGAVVTNMSVGTSDEGFAAEWRMVQLLTVDGDRITRLEIFDEDDIDAALAGFEELSRPAPRLENAATQVYERFWPCFAARDWASMAETLAAEIFTDDRRRIVNAGVQQGRDFSIASMRSLAEIGANISWTVIATRGERLVLSRVRSLVRDLQHGEFDAEMLSIIEIDADNRIAAGFTFDLDDVDAAFAELDARYLAGEAAAHAHTWSLIAGTYASIRQRVLAATTPDWVNIDHRRVAAYAPGEAIAYIRAGWELDQHITTHIEEVHRLNNLGAVVTHAGYGTSKEGFDAEWRGVHILTIDGDLVSRSELFDEADIDAALARFEELHPTAPRLENAASRVDERLWTYFAARDWNAIAEMLAAEISTDDRCRVVGAGVREGRDAELTDMRAWADLGVTNVTSDIIATRGVHLRLARTRFSGRDQRPDAFYGEYLGILEIDADERFVARLWFDPEDIDAAFEELDARYLAGEAAAHPHTWSLVAGAYAAFNRRELPATTPDWANIDHRRGTGFAPGDAIPYVWAAWDVAPDINIYILAVHRLSSLGAVVTYAANGTSEEGFDAEWREITELTFKGDLISRCEIFDEADIDSALARFDELDRPAPQLENAATQTWRQIVDACNRRDADGFLALTSADGELEDRRKGLHVSLEGSARRKAAESLCRAPKSWRMEVEPIAVRGYRLGLTRERWRDTDEADRPITVEALTLTEVTGDELVHHTEVFDPDDIDEAFAALDARYLAGEAAAYAHTWSVIAGSFAAINRHELPEFTPDFVNIDHRRAIVFAPGEMTAYIHATLDDAPDVRIYIEAVHRLTTLGAVCTHAARNTSQQGFEAEWREINISTVDGHLINRCELFDEADIDAALARFDELNRPA
jgi:hypothetical protein